MALGDPYITLPELRKYLEIDDTHTSMDIALTDAARSASQEIERHCFRQFNKQDNPTERTYRLESRNSIRPDDFWTPTGLVISIDDVLYTDDYSLWPRDGVVDGQIGWPFNMIRGRFSYLWNRHYDGTPVEAHVTACWGWPQVPAPVRQACLILAAYTYKLQDVPLGVESGNKQYPTKIQGMAPVQNLLCKYVRTNTNILVG